MAFDGETVRHVTRVPFWVRKILREVRKVLVLDAHGGYDDLKRLIAHGHETCLNFNFGTLGSLREEWLIENVVHLNMCVCNLLLL